MSIFHNGKEYGATKVINYSASPDYNRGVAVTNIQDGNYQATDNGFLLIELQSQQSNVTKVSVIRSQNPITDNTGTEIASRVIQQFQYSETLTVQVMAREYYKLLIGGVGNPQVLSCVFYPYASTVPMKLTENISIEQVEGLGELAVVDNVDLTTQTTGVLPVNKGGTGGTNINVDLTTQTTGVLPVNKGGTGGTNINDARKNLQTFRQSMFKEGADLNNISLYTKEMTIKYFNNNLLNRPSDLAQTGDYVTVLNLSQKRGWQRFYESGVSANGSFRVAGRLYSNNVWGEWKILRNVDGSIPAELINLPVGFSYIQAKGTGTPDTVFGTTGKWQEMTSTAANFPAGTRIWKKIS